MPYATYDSAYTYDSVLLYDGFFEDPIVPQPLTAKKAEPSHFARFAHSAHEAKHTNCDHEARRFIQ